MAVELRRIGAGEWRELRDLRLRSLQDAPDAFASTYEEESIRPDADWAEWTMGLVEGGSSFGLVAQRNGQRIGMAIGAPHRDHPGEAGLFAMWVDPSARGAGVGRALVEGVVAWAASAGFPVLRLRVTMSNDAAVRLYTRCGFSDGGRRLPLREGSDVVTMSMTMDLRTSARP
jgi:ribosomal protein S18 acetylase RimI-like enzyme